MSFFKSIFGKIRFNSIYSLLILFFASRFINLTLLPIFNDEAIYLDWGWRETHAPGMLYYSLYDGKQPFLMWIFGISQSIFSDPLFAGRLISVLTGAATMWIIYLLAKSLFDKKIAIISAILYVFVPIFVFYDRQALMESAISLVGVLSCYFSIKLWTENKHRNAYYLGLILGLGFFVKSSTLVFAGVFLIINLILFLRSKQKKENITATGIAIAVAGIVNFFLLINPDFWATFKRNSQYSLTFSELIHFPLLTIINNAIRNLGIGFYYLTPLVFVAAIVGIILIFRKKKRVNLIFCFCVLLSLVLQTIVIRQTSQRYLVSFLPLLVIPAAYLFENVIRRKKVIGLIFVSVSLLVPIIFTSLQLFLPSSYLISMSKINKFSDDAYLKTFTSGYGIIDVKNYLESVSVNKKIWVGFALNTGNPESALLVYFYKSNHISTTYFDSQLFSGDLSKIDCLKTPVKLYFVSREDQQAGLNKFFQKIKTFQNPYSNYSIGIYELKSQCVGKTVEINPFAAL